MKRIITVVAAGGLICMSIASGAQTAKKPAGKRVPAKKSAGSKTASAPAKKTVQAPPPPPVRHADEGAAFFGAGVVAGDMIWFNRKSDYYNGYSTASAFAGVSVKINPSHNFGMQLIVAPVADVQYASLRFNYVLNNMLHTDRFSLRPYGFAAVTGYHDYGYYFDDVLLLHRKHYWGYGVNVGAGALFRINKPKLNRLEASFDLSPGWVHLYDKNMGNLSATLGAHWYFK
ncbi:hypothetical protein ACTHGU_17940 [Chitinophagaceae bacterium MMS25-I14]